MSAHILMSLYDKKNAQAHRVIDKLKLHFIFDSPEKLLKAFLFSVNNWSHIDRR